ncbi:ABC transporter substrate-binding protein [Actinomycetospora sp. NBRC 106378]|uniref:ABC transporter substrate-binding protein n=1 Tax=Actinomycetospora sp. NBRC 106378 TaxID=3032208 RepID=UPI002553C32C|nr:ABC transporter substrate-binding protein [Actinomycetospora sp. NBRC 106378]
MIDPRRRTAPAVALALLLVLAACGTSAPPPGARTVTDSTGDAVTVPERVERVADAWPAHNEVMAILGAGAKVVATVSNPKQTPWLYVVNPHMQQAPTVFTNSTADVEGLLAQKPDVVFLPTNSQVSAALGGIGVPAVQLNFTDYPGLKQMMTTTGDVLGGDAPRRAADYNGYLDATLAKVTGATGSLPDAQRPSVLHVTSLNPLTVDGTDTIIDAWIRAAGGRNAATVKGNNIVVGTEQLLAWRPDVLILGSTTLVDPKDPDRAVRDVLGNPTFAGLPAVASRRVLLNPVGAFFWDRYSAEGALQLLWAGKTLHPELFGDVDLNATTRDFYGRFLDYPLSPAQADAILGARTP